MADIPSDALRETWDSIYEMSVKLAKLIEEHCRKSGERFDAVVVVPRGSYYPANIVARELGFGSTDLLQAAVKSYIPNSTARTEFKLGQMPLGQEVSGKNLLIIEEVCDHGHTLKFLTDRLKEQGAELVRTGVLHYKPAHSETGFVPDWAVTETDKWIVYPWEIHDKEDQASIVKR
jgi:hypoxanthine phosphoribosyltransferase